jgi:PAS domain S-box-containing protein
MLARLEKLMAGEKIPQTVEYCIRTKGGEELWALLNARYIYEAGKLKGATGVIYNITDRRKVAEALRESEIKYRALIETTQTGYVIIDQVGLVLDANPEYVRLTGHHDLNEIVGRSVIEWTADHEKEKNAAAVGECFKKGYIRNLEIDYVDSKGSFTPIEMNATYMESEGVPQILTLCRDITERKRADEALRESESLSKSLIDYMHDAMIILDWDGSILFANRAAARIIEFERPEEFVGHNMIEYLHPDSLQKAAEDLEAVMAGKMGFRSEYQLYSVTGRHIWVESIGGKILFRNASVNLVCIRDITERKQAEEELLRTLESLRKAVGATIQVMVSAVEARDPYTAGHQIRSADLARTIATEMGLPQGTIDAIRMAGSIHDIGKLYVPSELLTKPSRLTDIEFSLIKEHSRRGYEMLKDVESPWPLAEIIYQHHERMDGSGYPRNLKGDDILIEARILAVADVVESMASHRPYRPSLGIDAALEEIEKNRGTLYDDAVADACLRLFREKGYQLQ